MLSVPTDTSSDPQGDRVSWGKMGMLHSLGGHRLFSKGDEGHSQGLVLHLALFLCDLLQQLVIQASIVGDGILLPGDTTCG